MTQEIIEYIQENGLNKKSRFREYSYRRMFLSDLLRKQGLTLQAIADVFNRTHATIIHGINAHKYFMKSNDSIYLMHVQKELDLFTPQFEFKRCIFEDILAVNNTTDLMEIKQRILNKEY